MALKVLYEDNHIIIINKRPGEIAQGDKTGDEPLSEKVRVYLKEKYSKPGEVFLGVVHRLDRPVSGALMLARTSKALSRLNQMLKERQIRKVYWAVTSRQSAVGSQQLAVGSRQLVVKRVDVEKSQIGMEDIPRAEWQTLIHYLKRNEKQNKSYAFDEPGPGRVRAELKFRKIAESDRYDLLEVELITGRHHQIRAQLAATGMPIRGDLKYGYPRSNPDGSIHLHARQIGFIHPVKKEAITIIAPAPEDKLWDFFSGIFAK